MIRALNFLIALVVFTAVLAPWPTQQWWHPVLDGIGLLIGVANVIYALMPDGARR